jgi:hypothetical protein
MDEHREGLVFIHYAEGPRFCRGMNAPSATGCRISILRLFEPKVDFGAADSCRRGSTNAIIIKKTSLIYNLILQIFQHFSLI